MTISVFSVPYNSSTFDVGVIERWIVIIGGKLCHFRSSPVGQATSDLGWHTMVRAINTLKFVTHRFLVACDSSFHAVFSVFLAASPLVASAYGRRFVGLRPTPKIPAAREKNLWYPGYKNRGYACKLFMFLSVFWGRTCGPSPLLCASLFSVVINTIDVKRIWLANI